MTSIQASSTIDEYSKEKVNELCRLLRNQEATLRTYKSGSKIHECASILCCIINYVPCIQSFMEKGMKDWVARTYKNMLETHDRATKFIKENNL